MPAFILNIPNVEETISSSIIYGITTRILRTLKFYRDEDINIIFLSNSNSTYVKGSDIDTSRHDRSQNRLPSDAMIKIEVDERYNENMSRSTALREGSEQAIFRCNKTKTTMHPGYQQMIATINLNIRFTNRHAAESFRRKARAAAVQSVDGIKVQSKYNYTIPYAFLQVLDHIYTLMETKHGYGIELGDWLRESFTNTLTSLSNQSGSQVVLAIEEQQQGVLVLFQDFDDTPKKEKENDQDTWSVNLTFEVYYDRPDVMRLSFQHIINNQLIKPDYMNRFKVQRQDYLDARTNIALYGAIQTGDVKVGKNYLSGAQSPIFDDWLPSVFTDYYPDALRIMLLVDEVNRKNVINLTEIADWEFSEATLNWLKATRLTIGIKWFNILYFQLWEWDVKRSSSLLLLDENLNLTFSEDLDPRKNYHLTIGMCVNPAQLDQSVWDLLKEHPDFLKDYLEVISPHMKDWIYNRVMEYWENWGSTEINPWTPGDPWWWGNQASQNGGNGINPGNGPGTPGAGGGWGNGGSGGSGGSGGGSPGDNLDWNNIPPKVIDDLKDYLDEWYRERGVQKMKMKTVMFAGVIAKRK